MINQKGTCLTNLCLSTQFDIPPFIRHPFGPPKIQLTREHNMIAPDSALSTATYAAQNIAQEGAGEGGRVCRSHMGRLVIYHKNACLECNKPNTLFKKDSYKNLNLRRAQDEGQNKYNRHIGNTRVQSFSCENGCAHVVALRLPHTIGASEAKNEKFNEPLHRRATFDV